jgi:hypothetical protein
MAACPASSRGVMGKVAKPITLTIDYITLQKAGGLLLPSHTESKE